MDKTERKAELRRQLDTLWRSGATEVSIFKTILQLEIDDAKDLLVSASGEEVLKLQGKAKAMEVLLRELARPAATE